MDGGMGWGVSLMEPETERHRGGGGLFRRAGCSFLSASSAPPPPYIFHRLTSIASTLPHLYLYGGGWCCQSCVCLLGKKRFAENEWVVGRFFFRRYQDGKHYTAETK